MQLRVVIDSSTPYKLREIIQDTWPNLYRPPKDWKPPAKIPIDFGDKKD